MDFPQGLICELQDQVGSYDSQDCIIYVIDLDLVIPFHHNLGMGSRLIWPILTWSIKFLQQYFKSWSIKFWSYLGLDLNFMLVILKNCWGTPGLGNLEKEMSLQQKPRRWILEKKTPAWLRKIKPWRGKLLRILCKWKGTLEISKLWLFYNQE